MKNKTPSTAEIWLLLLLFSFFPLSYIQAQSSEEASLTKGLSIEVISNIKNIAPNEPFEIALKIKHDPHFHTYWKNPGVVGMPTSIKWRLPADFKTSAIQWPYPEVSNMKTYPCYGYERDVLLSTTITPPKELTSPTIKIEAEVLWMCCADSGCYPGHKTFSLLFPVSEKSTPSKYANEFLLAKETLPKISDVISSKIISEKHAKIINIEIHTTLSPFIIKHIYNEDAQSSPDLPYTLSKIDNHTYRYTCTRSEFSPTETSSFPMVIESNLGFFSSTAHHTSNKKNE